MVRIPPFPPSSSVLKSAFQKVTVRFQLFFSLRIQTMINIECPAGHLAYVSYQTFSFFLLK